MTTVLTMILPVAYFGVYAWLLTRKSLARGVGGRRHG